MIPERIARKIEVADCWVWTGARINGYGQTSWEGRGVYVHRLVRHLLVGDVTPRAPSRDSQLDHLCRNPACCNPDHTEPVSQSENIQRRAKGCCINGHAYTPANTHINRKGSRVCRICNRAKVARRRLKKKNSKNTAVN